MLQALHHRQVRILKFHVLTDETNANWSHRSIDAVDKRFPLRQVNVTFNAQHIARNGVETFFMKNEWKFVNVASISSVNDRVCVNVTHVRDLALQTRAQRFFASTHNDVGLNTTRTKFGDTVLSWFGLLLTTWADKGHQCDVDIANIVAPGFVTELTNGFKKRKNFNVTNCSAHLSDDYVSVFGGDTANTALNFVSDVGNDLNGLSQVVTTTLCGQDCLINGTSGCIGRTREIFVNESFVVTEVKVGFTAIVGDENFSVFKRIHCSWIDVDVRI